MKVNLDTLLGTMSAKLIDGLYVFATISDRDIPNGIQARMTFQEAEGTTLIMHKEQAEARGLPYEFPCRMISLEVHSSLEAVGFLARITTALAKHGLGVNPVSGFYHDHLFVPDGKEKDALRILQELANEESR